MSERVGAQLAIVGAPDVLVVLQACLTESPTEVQRSVLAGRLRDVVETMCVDRAPRSRSSYAWETGRHGLHGHLTSQRPHNPSECGKQVRSMGIRTMNDMLGRYVSSWGLDLVRVGG